jgi:hypothetical protein
MFALSQNQATSKRPKAHYWRRDMSISAISSGYPVGPTTSAAPAAPAAQTQSAAPAPAAAKDNDGDTDHGVEPAGASAAAKSSPAVQSALTSLAIGG